jgi:hypothetical protein
VSDRQGVALPGTMSGSGLSAGARDGPRERANRLVRRRAGGSFMAGLTRASHKPGHIGRDRGLSAAVPRTAPH